jgi:hypothetical protein
MNETIYGPVIKSGYINISYGIFSVQIYRVTLFMCIYKRFVSEKDGLNLWPTCDVCTVRFVQFIDYTNICTTYIYQ